MADEMNNEKHFDEIAQETAPGSAKEKLDAAGNSETAETDKTADTAENAADSLPSDADSAAESADIPAEENTGKLSELDQALLEAADLKEQLARRNADLYNVQQEYSNYVKRTRLEAQAHKEAGVQKVLETLFSVLDNAALAREHGELTGPAGKVVAELENTLRTNFSLERFGSVGDEFDPTIHEALMHQTSADAEKEEVSVLIQAGYKQGEKILRPARVGVISPE
ncbi:nucleotide exchange factor GrpE [Arcanobacterium hippocoleae]